MAQLSNAEVCIMSGMLIPRRSYLLRLSKTTRLEIFQYEVDRYGCQRSESIEEAWLVQIQNEEAPVYGQSFLQFNKYLLEW